MASGGMVCVKYLLFCFNLMFAVSGIAIVTVGAVFHLAYSHYQNFMYASFQSVPMVMIVVGSLIFIVAFFGCCGAVVESHCMIFTYAILLVIILTMELATGVVGYVRRNEIESMLQSKLNSTMFDYYKNENFRNTWDIVQHEAECCGMTKYTDWTKVNRNESLPHTCCPNAPDDGTCTTKSPEIYQDSCYIKLRDTFTNYASALGAVGFGIGLAQIIGILFACCLARTINDEYATV